VATSVGLFRRSIESFAATIAAVFGLSILAATAAHALDPDRALTQYGHSAWRIQDGVIAGAVTSFAQTKDGYLWVGTRDGLFRFNGAELVPFKPSKGEPVRSPKILSLLGAHDGSLWIGTGNDVEHWSGGELIHFPSAVGYILSSVLDIHETRDAQIWIARSNIPAGEGPLCRIQVSDLVCFGTKQGVPMHYVMDILENARGHLLIHSDDQIIDWDPKSQLGEVMKTIEVGEDGVQTLAVDSAGSLLIGSVSAAGGYGLSVLQNGHLEPLKRQSFDGSSIPVQSIFIDANKALWIGTQGKGLYRIAGDQAQHYGAQDGLSSDSVNKIFEDREGNIWVATQEGVDRFRDIKVATFSVHEGLSDDQVNGVVAARDGSKWIGNAHSLDVMRGSTVTAYRGGKELPGEEVTSLFEDRQGRMWVGVDKKLTVFDHGKFRTVGGANNEVVGSFSAIMDDAQGYLWLISQAGLHGYVLQLEGEIVRRKISFEQLPIAKAGVIASDLKSGVWLPLLNGDLAHWHDDAFDIVAFHHPSHTGNLTGLVTTPDGSVYSSSALGVNGVRGNLWQTLDQKNGLPCAAVRAMISDEERLWLYADCGLLSVRFTELEKWWQDPKARLDVQILDSFDGAQPASAAYYPKASRSPDGRLWFANASVLQVFDPSRIKANSISPLVQIERIVADDIVLDASDMPRLRPLTRSVHFDYMSSSFSIPQKAKFRYQLEGYDKEWQEAGNRRQAFYTGLPPGKFRFRVIASNNDDVWNTTGASQSLEISPAFFQTRSFIAFAVVAVAGILWLVYLMRVRQVTADVRMRADERIKEREQIARDLHDTLLQGVQGLMYQFQAATERLPKSEAVRAVLEESLNHADDLISQGRESVSGLRRSAPMSAPLEDALNIVAMGLAKGRGTSYRSNVQGTSRQLSALTREELFRIGSEALINAFTHASAKLVELELVYEHSDVLLRVRDDGSGFDVDSWKEGAPNGHFGLLGIQERARRIKSRADIWSRPGAGTEISVRVSGERDIQREGLLARWRWLVSKIHAGDSAR
jgi:signal transduction histidine kinase/ligand-binding sensor domain-containing protein